MHSSSAEPVAYAPLAGDGDVVPTQSSSDSRPSSTPSILSRLHLDFSRATLLYLRLLAFFIIEAGCITLAAVCLARPLPLSIPFSLTQTEVKSGFIVASVIWQLLAIFMASDLVADAFSQEWSAQLRQSHRKTIGGPPAAVPVGIDRVSTITSGFLDRVHHLFVDKSSGTFKMAFLASLLLSALSALGPGTINVGATLKDESTTVQIGRLLGHSQNITREVIWTINRAKLILQIEKIENLTYGFNLPPNMLAPVPKVDLASFNGTIEYDSDIIEFHYNCGWEAPQFLNISGETLVVAAGQQWVGAVNGTDHDSVGSSIGPLRLRNVSMMEEVGISTFIFTGGNSSFLKRQFRPPVPFGVDLGTLPATFVRPSIGVDAGGFSLFAPLSSILICDPRAQITGGRVRVTNDGTLTVITSGKMPIGNIPRGAANWIFTTAFLNAMSIIDIFLSRTNFATDIATATFIPNSTTVDWDNAYDIRPLDLLSINKNMDAFMLSAGKAYIDGSKSDGSKITVEYVLDTVSATGQKQTIVLMASKRFFVATVILVAMTTVLLSALCKSVLAHNRYPLDWEHIVKVFGKDGEGRASLVVPRNPGCAD